MVTVAIADVSQKVSLKGQSPLSSITNNFLVWNGIGVLSLTYLLLSRQPLPSVNYAYFIQLLPMTVLYFLGGSFYYQSFKSKSVSLSAVLATVSSVISTFLGIILYHESTHPLKFIGSIVVVIAIILVNFHKNSHFDKYNLYALVGGIFYGFAYTLDKHFILNSSPDFYQTVLCFAVGSASLVFSPARIVSELKQFKQSLLPSIFSSIIFFFLYQKFYFYAYTIGGEVGRIDVLNNTTIFIVIFLEYFLLHERSNLSKKIVAASIATVGATILAIAK
jgi:drug/metabolite transporter (DMT)-like permease